ncbi:MAG TPA: D-hexose-6-phosphate mutarotase [Methylophilaceae bacterium]|nr:D-hexose-6-phosphate mutarotase [Methylophilaceae bacterium]
MLLATPVNLTNAVAHPHIKITEDENGLQYIEVDNPSATAKIALQGAHIMHWQPKKEKHPVLWLSDHARYVKGRSIRGGVPICWPWFGAHPTDSSLCPHGFARVIPWQLIDADSTYSGATRIALQMIQTPEADRQLSYPYVLTLMLTIGRRLKIDLATTNKAAHPFMIGEAFHTYFHISDIEKIRITGLQECLYADKVRQYERHVEHGLLKFGGEFDRVYLNHSADCIIHDAGFDRLIRVSKSGSNTTVVWTPGAEKAHAMGDMGEGDEWRKMVCVESANAMENSVVINPNRTHNFSAEYNVETL